MRALDVLRALSDRELGPITEEVKGRGRKSLSRLYAELKKYRKRSGEPTQEELFFTTFEKEYSSGQNYLLRNELRILNELIYDHLIRDTFSNYLKKHRSTYYYWLIRTFFERKLNNAFEADVDRFIDYCKEYIKPEDTSRLFDLKGLWMINNKPKTLENLEEQLAAIDNWQEEEIRRARYKIRELEARRAYIESVMVSLRGQDDRKKGDARTVGLDHIDLRHTGTDPFEEYLILKKHSYQTKGETRIDVLKRMLAIEEDENFSGEYSTKGAQVSTLNSMAMECILQGRFAEADQHILDSIRRCEEYDLAIVPSSLQNYIANQINQQEYKRALSFYEKYNHLIKDNRQYIAIHIYKAYCHLFMGQPEKALAALPVNEKLTDHQNLMTRMVYLIVFILRKQYDLALNESRNIARMIKAHEGQYFQHYEWINNLYNTYIHATLKNREERKRSIQEIARNMQTHQHFDQLLITEFSLRWLNEALKQAQ